MPTYDNSPGTTVSREQAAQWLYAAGFRGQDLINMVAVIDAESSFRPGIHRTDSSRSALTGDFGLWQINYIHFPELRAAGIMNHPNDLFDPMVNARAAKFIHDQGGMRLWVGWRNTGSSDIAAAAAAVQRATASGMISETPGATRTTTGTTATTAAATGKLPTDARLVQNDSGLFALFQIGPGVWIHYGMPRDGSVSFTGKTIERLSNAAYTKKYGVTVSGGRDIAEGVEELTEVATTYGTYGGYRDAILNQLFTPGDPRRNDTEILRLVADRAGRPDMTDAEFENRIKATAYYQARTEGELAWNDLSEAERQTRRDDMEARMNQAVFQYIGHQASRVGGTPGGFLFNTLIKSHIEALASGKMGFGQWTETVLKPRADDYPESPWSRQLREEREMQRERPIAIENTVNQLRQSLNRWGVKWDEVTLTTYARALIEKTKSDDDVNQVMQKQAAKLYPGLQLDGSMETIVAAAPWLEVYNRTMEAQGTMQTAEINQALRQGTDPWEFEQQLRMTDEYDETKGGEDTHRSNVSELASMTGH